MNVLFQLMIQEGPSRTALLAANPKALRLKLATYSDGPEELMPDSQEAAEAATADSQEAERAARVWSKMDQTQKATLTEALKTLFPQSWMDKIETLEINVVYPRD
jgi:hypothetical protein